MIDFPLSLLQLSVSSYVREVSILFILTSSLLLSSAVVFIAGCLAVAANLVLLLSQRKQRFYWLMIWVTGSLTGTNCVYDLIIEVLSLTCISFIGLLTIAGIAIVARDLSQTQLAPGLLSRLEQEYAMPGGEMLTRVLDLVQSDLQCCGISGPGDYEKTAWQAGRDSSQLRLPLTCCSLAHHGAGAFLEPSPLNITLCQAQHQETFKHSQVSV